MILLVLVAPSRNQNPDPGGRTVAPSVASYAGLSLDRSRIMGVINVTPDSFSDGGEAFALEDAIARGKAMVAAGADILDIGGESTRPGSQEVSVNEELRRVLPVIEGLLDTGVALSIDTRHGHIMDRAITAGAHIINDITALTGDPDALQVAARLGCPVILMHMQGEPGTMQKQPSYDNAPQEIYDYLQRRIEACQQAGIEKSRIAVDPGIGFGKTVEHNLQILNRISGLHDLGCAVVLGVSRKRFIGAISGAQHPQDRLPGSLAAVVHARINGVQIFRVHDVAETRQALDVCDRIQAVSES